MPMHRQTLLALALLLASSACPPVTTGDDDDSTATDDDDSTANDDDSATTDDDDSTPARIEPSEGIWALTLTELTADDCDLQPGVQPGDSLGTTTLTLVQPPDIDFTLTDSDDQVFHCSWTEGDSFVCNADLWTDTINAALFPNATLNRNGSRSGTFTSATAATLTNINVDTCEGDDCPLVEQAGGYVFPCTLGFDATMAR